MPLTIFHFNNLILLLMRKSNIKHFFFFIQGNLNQRLETSPPFLGDVPQHLQLNLTYRVDH